VCEPGFGALAWWQVSRALGGNSLSWVYVFEWPFFGAYAVVLWWRIVHDQQLMPERLARAVASPATTAGAAELETTTDVADAVNEAAADRDGGRASPASLAAAGGRAASESLAATDRTGRRRSHRGRRGEDRAREEERELAAYNRYLAALNAEDPPKRW
jgi:hypothetical protein